MNLIPKLKKKRKKIIKYAKKFIYLSVFQFLQLYDNKKIF